ncbi:MAG: muconolactone Delta-isomerase family protein [Saprospiraceae bacterium]
MHEYQFMVDFSLPKVLSEEFLRLIPHQRTAANKLFREGKLINLAIALDNSKMWAVVNANDEKEVAELIKELPLTRFMKCHISLLTIFNAVNAENPVFSLN